MCNLVTMEVSSSSSGCAACGVVVRVGSCAGLQRLGGASAWCRAGVGAGIVGWVSLGWDG